MDGIHLVDFFVWAVSKEAKPFNGKFLWASWDVEELIARREEIVGTGNINLGLTGWPKFIQAAKQPLVCRLQRETGLMGDDSGTMSPARQDS